MTIFALKFCRMKHFRLIILSCLVGLGWACTKANEPTTKSEILQSKTWMVESVEASGYLTGLIYQRGRTPEGSQYDMSKVRVTFYSSGSATAIDNTGNSQTSGKWTLTDADTKINITGSGNYLLDGSGDINTLSTTQFVFSGERTYKSQSVKAVVRMIPAQ